MWRKSPNSQKEMPAILITLSNMIESVLIHSTGTPLHLIMITDKESKDQVGAIMITDQ